MMDALLELLGKIVALSIGNFLKIISCDEKIPHSDNWLQLSL